MQDPDGVITREQKSNRSTIADRKSRKTEPASKKLSRKSKTHQLSSKYIDDEAQVVGEDVSPTDEEHEAEDLEAGASEGEGETSVKPALTKGEKEPEINVAGIVCNGSIFNLEIQEPVLSIIGYLFSYL